MVAERKPQFQESSSPDVRLIEQEVVLTRFPNFDIKVAVAKSPDKKGSVQEKIASVGCISHLSEIDLADGRTLFIDSPSVVNTFGLESMHQESKQSSARYLARYEEPGKSLFLVQYLDGTSSRHMHPRSSEAFTVLDGDYFIHDEENSRTIHIPDIKQRHVTLRPQGSDHQCFNLGRPAIAIVHLTGPDFYHEQRPMRSLDFLQERARRILAA